MQKEEGASRVRRIVLAGVFFVVAFLLRVFSWPLVFREGAVYPAGGDAFYHLRRITYTIENFPSLLSRDAYLNYPHGGEVIWSPAFDWGMAAISWLLIGAGDAAAVERLLMWVPPLLGAATVSLLYCIARRHFSSGVAAAAAALLCVLPAHVQYSRLGALDHHVAVALCAAWMLAASMRLFERAPQGPGLRSPELRSALWLGVAIGSSLVLWPGSLIHVGVLQAALLARLLSCDSVEPALAWSRAMALLHGVACLVVLPFAVGAEWEVWGSFSPVVLSNFQPAYLAAISVGSLALVQVWKRLGFPASGGLRVVQAASLLLAALGIAAAMLPELGAATLDALGWLLKAEEFQAVVAESAPLFSRGGGLEFSRAELLLSRGIYLAPIAIAVLGLSLRRESNPRLALLLWWATCFFAATLLQRRFMNSFALLHALVLTLAAEQLLAWLRSQVPSSPMARRAAFAVGVAVLAFLCFPMIGWYANDAANWLRVSRGQAVRAVGTDYFHSTLIPVARWLREHSNETSGYFDASQTPEYGLLSAWGDGHVLTYVARRPEVQGNFGDDIGAHNFELAERYFSARREADAVDLLREVGARYVVVRRSGSGHARGGYPPTSLWARMYLPLRLAAERLPAANEVHELSLVHHRLIHESPSPPPPTGARKIPYYAVYERVEGARVLGRATPGEVVEAELKLVTTHGSQLRFVTRSRVTPEGRYRLILPYPSDGEDTTIRSGPRYRIRSSGAEGRLTVSEAQVREGSEVVGPDL